MPSRDPKVQGHPDIYG